MSAIETRTEPLLQVVSGHIEEIVPIYTRSQADVLEAVKNGVGNCLSKAVIATVVFEHITQEGNAAVFYNRDVHPSEYSDMLGKSHKGFGHAAMLAQTDSGLWTLGFNINNDSSGDRYIVPANDEEERIVVTNGKIQATQEYSEELAVGDWYKIYREYMEAVNILDSSAHTMEREELRQIILGRIIDPPKQTDPTSSALSAA